jgi:hypothetical protein
VQITGSGGRGALDLGAYLGGELAKLLVLTNGAQQVNFYAMRGAAYHIAAAGSAEAENPFVGIVAGQPAPPTLKVFQIGDVNRLRLSGLAGQSFVVQSNRAGVGWETVRIDTLQDSELELSLPAGDYRVIPLEDVLLNTPLKLVAVHARMSEAATLEISGRPGQPFLLQGSTDFANWSDLHRGTIIGENLIIRDSTSLPLNCRFYRIQPME